MKKLWLVLSVLLCASTAGAQGEVIENEFHKGVVVEAHAATTEEVFGTQNLAQELRVQLDDGRIVAVPAGQYQAVVPSQLLNVGDKVILASNAGKNFRILERNRLFSLAVIMGLFFVLIFLIAGKQGLSGLGGLIISLLAIGGILIPQVLNGFNPLIVSLMVCTIITGVSIWISHGWKPRTHLAVAATFSTLLLAFGLSWGAIFFSHLHGLGSENSYFLHVALPNIDLSGLLLGAILLGTVGILDDVTTTQCATIDELAKANSTLSWKELFTRGMSVGREHVTSMINTLALAYVAAALPMFLLIALDTERPWWVILNSEFFAEEIVRTLLGSGALVLAVPIATIFSAVYFTRKR